MGWGCLSGQKHRLFLEKLFVNMRPLEAQLPSFLFASTVLNGQAVELSQKAMASYWSDWIFHVLCMTPLT